MNKFYHLTPEMLFALLFFHTALQQQLIEAQQKIIQLQQRIDEMTPKNHQMRKFCGMLRQMTVNPKVYSECLNQMTRGLSERIIELEEAEEKKPLRLKKRTTKLQQVKKPEQLLLIQ